MAVNSMPDSKICALCNAVADATLFPDPFLFNSKLYETPRFVVLPSLGPLMPGHIMIVSKEHYLSLASMGQDAVNEYDELAAYLRNGPFLQGSNALEAEHGSTLEDKAGACVVHAHVHLMPRMGKFMDEFKRKLSVRNEANLLELGPTHVPYIYVRAESGHLLFDAHGLPSQSIRRILCDVLDRDDTDWTQSPRLDWVKETVEGWQKHQVLF
jgi:ATP adenylyltransferase